MPREAPYRSSPFTNLAQARTSCPDPSGRRPRPRGLGARSVLAIAVAALSPLVAGSCSGSGSAPQAPAGSASAPPAGTVTSSRGTERAAPVPAADQTPPKGANGVRFRDGVLWVADYQGDQILNVDPGTGAILARFGKDQGVTGGPDDLAVADDGTVFWTGFVDGTVGVLRDGKGRALANVGAGANGIAFGPAGQLYVTRAVTGDGLYRVDPSSGAVEQLSDNVGNVNAFSFVGDRIYGPSYANQQGSLVAIDLSGQVVPIATGMGFPSSVRFKPPGAGGTPAGGGAPNAFVLQGIPPQVLVVDLGSGTATPYATPATKTVDNMDFAPDGTLYVTGFNEPAFTVVKPDGSTKLVMIGKH